MPAKNIDDLAAFYQTKTVDGEFLAQDIQPEEDIQIILPTEPANRVVAVVMKKVMVSIDPIKIHDWSLSVEIADLYYRPLYVFEFERMDKDGTVIDRKHEQLDAINGEWSQIPSPEIKQPAALPWDKILT